MNKSVSRRVLSFVMALAMVLTTVIATPVSTQAASMKLTMSATKVTVCVGKSATVKVKKVTGTKNKAVTYATSDKKVATVDKKGKITGKKVGKATITATLKANKKVKEKITVTVVQGTKNITTTKSVTIPVKKSITLKSTVLPTNAKNKGLKYKSSNTKVATVDKKGKITGKKAGKATITVSAADGCAKSVKVSVKVVKKATAVSSIKLNAKSKKVYPGSKFTLKATVSPSKATTKSVYWLSSNPDVATVDAKGNVKAVKSGKATITAYACDASGKKASCTVTVNTYVSSVKLNQTTAELFEGEELQLKTTISPSKATNKAVTWTSSNTAVATVSTSGKVTAVAAGTATITATAKDGSKKKASCKVTVKAKEVEPSETPSEAPSETPSEAPVEPEKPTFYETTLEKGKDYTIKYDGKEFFASSQNIERAYNQYVKNYELSDTDLFDKIDRLVTLNDVLSGATVDVAVNGNMKTVTVTRNGRTKTVTITKGSSAQDEVLGTGAQYKITTEMFGHTYTVVADYVSVTAKNGTSIITAKVSASPDVKATYFVKAVLTATNAEVHTCDVNADGQYVEKELVVKADVTDNGYTFGVQKTFANTIYDDLADASEKLPADINEFIDGIGGITIVK